MFYYSTLALEGIDIEISGFQIEGEYINIEKAAEGKNMQRIDKKREKFLDKLSMKSGT